MADPKSEQPERVEGEIAQDEAGNVVIGAPVAAAAAKSPLPFGDDEEDED